MEPIGKTLQRLRKEQRMKQTEVAEWLSRHHRPTRSGVVSAWECGDALPNAEQFLQLCRLYGIADVGETFMGHTRLNAEGRQKLREFALLLEQAPQYRAAATAPAPAPQVPTRLLRFYQLPASAGFGQFLDDEVYELREVDSQVPPQADYAVRVAGNSMEPRFADGQWLYVQQQNTLQPGETGLFLYDGEAYCKQLGQQGGLPALLSFNAAYSPIVVAMPQELRVLGKVVGQAGHTE